MLIMLVKRGLQHKMIAPQLSEVKLWDRLKRLDIHSISLYFSYIPMLSSPPNLSDLIDYFFFHLLLF